MKKIIGITFSVLFLCSSCVQFSRQPLFTEILGKDVKPVTLIKKTLTKSNTVLLFFSEEVVFTNAEIIRPDAKKNSPCIIEPLILTEETLQQELGSEFTETATAFSLKTEESIEIGEKFFLKGSVSDMAHTTLDFVFSFKGINSRPAHLCITEVRPLYSSKPKSEFIELLVTESGNLSGITLINIGDKKSPHYTFPACEVEKGELIVYHFRSVEAGIKDEISKKIVSGGTQACPNARDFWGPYSSIPRRNANAILVKTNLNGSVQDAVLYCTQKEYEKNGKTAWQNSVLLTAAQEAAQSGIWHGKGELKDAVIVPLTASKSLKRKNIHGKTNNAKSWILCDAKAVTMGSLR
ncbi:MAG: hypothetical protein ACTTH8_08015 [Treponema sp.]